MSTNTNKSPYHSISLPHKKTPNSSPRSTLFKSLPRPMLNIESLTPKMSLTLSWNFPNLNHPKLITWQITCDKFRSLYLMEDWILLFTLSESSSSPTIEWRKSHNTSSDPYIFYNKLDLQIHFQLRIRWINPFKAISNRKILN